MGSKSKLLIGFVAITYLFFLVIPMALLGTIAGLQALLPSPSFPPSPANFIAAAVVFVFGGYWVASSNLLLMKRGKGTSLEVAGRGVAVTQSLVTEGPYARVRNPMVFGYFVALGLGLPLLQHSVPGLLVCPLALLLYGGYLKKWEEQGLVERFGAAYERYRREVPMLVPMPGRRYREGS